MLQNDVIKCCKMMSHSNNCCVVYKYEPAICEDLDTTGNVQGLGANQIPALSTDGVLFPKSIRNMSEISEVSELCPKFEHCFYRNIANFW